MSNQTEVNLEERKEILSKLNSEISKYCASLVNTLALEADVTLNNSEYIKSMDLDLNSESIKSMGLDEIVSKKSELLTVISDLATVVKSLERGANHCFINSKNGFNRNTIKSFEVAGLNAVPDEINGIIYLF